MKNENDIAYLFKKKKQYEEELSKYKSKENLNSTVKVVIEEIERQIFIINKEIEKY
jgi:hypothetical protein